MIVRESDPRLYDVRRVYGCDFDARPGEPEWKCQLPRNVEGLRRGHGLVERLQFLERLLGSPRRFFRAVLDVVPQDTIFGRSSGANVARYSVICARTMSAMVRVSFLSTSSDSVLSRPSM